jgi:23S rRNA (guanosine2251-2'-O)-methyltransferase
MKEQNTLVYGHHPVVEAIEAGQAFEKVFIQQGMRGETEKTVRHLTKAHDIPMQVVPKERLNKMVKGNHQGVVGVLAVIRYHQLEEVLSELEAQAEVPLLLLLDGITDVRNFGAICRTAWCMGVQAVVVPQSGAALVNEEAMKAAAGALARLPVCRVRSLFSTVELLQQSDIQVVATDLGKRSKPLMEVDFTKPTALLMGSEGTGVHPKLVKMSDEVIIIPQGRPFDSLNVGVATGIVLYETRRQRIIT